MLLVHVNSDYLQLERKFCVFMAKKNGMRSWIKLMSASVSVHEVSVLQTKLLHEVLGNHPG